MRSGLLGGLRKFTNADLYVEHLARLRCTQYEADSADSVIERAKKVVAGEPSVQLLRATAIFVDWSYGFPPDQRQLRASQVDDRKNGSSKSNAAY